MRWSRTFALAALLALGAGALGAQAPTPARSQRPRMPHRTLNKEDCLSCHAATATRHVQAVPANHSAYQNAACVTCHRPAATLPPRSQHAFDAAHTRCQACHVAGNTVNAQPIPADHEGRTSANCVMCHEPQA